MNFQLGISKCLKQETLTWKDSPFKVPIGNIRDSSYLDLASSIDVAAK
jgi:hypothetical protein